MLFRQARAGSRRTQQALRAAARIQLEPLDPRVLLTGTVNGTILQDLNANGVEDPDEPALEGWTIFVDYNRNGTLDAGEPSAVTDEDGDAEISDVLEGTWDIVEQLQPGYVPAPGFDVVIRDHVEDDEETDVLFLNVAAANGTIQGTVWNDIANDGARDPTDPGLPGWTVFLDLNEDNDLSAGEPSDITDAAGFYSFPDLAPGDYRVRDITPPGWDPTVGGDNEVQVTLNPGQTRVVDFGNFNTSSLGAITGSVWNDVNADGVRAVTDVGLADWTLFIDTNANSTLDAGEVSTITDALGAFTFNAVLAGVHRVVEVLQLDWSASPGHPVARNVTVVGDDTSVVQFAVYTPALGSISGRVWNDQNSDGFINAGEAGIAGWTVFIDSNGDGVLDVGENSAITDANGNYALSNVAIGGNTVREIPAIGWQPTAPATGQRLVNVPNGTSVTGINFGNLQRTNSSISGLAFADKNEDGSRGATEKGLAGITVYIDANNNNIFDSGEQSTVTSSDLFYTPAVDEAGFYQFTHLSGGTYIVREILPDVLSATLETDRRKIVNLLPGEDRINVNFANRYREIEIRGHKYEDLNGNHERDPGEPGIEGVTIYLDLDRDNVLDPEEPRTLTAADGSYGFANDLEEGSYIVREISPWGFTQTYPTTTSGVLWPSGTSNPAVGNVSPTLIETSLAIGQQFTQAVSLTLPGSGALTNLVDVFLLFDDTGSFTANSPIVRAAFPQIISSLQAALPGIDLGFGVGRFEEYANFGAEFATGRPFILNQPIVSSSTPGFASAIQAALDRTAPGYGGDQPETDIEALFQAVTGRGFDGNNNGTTTDSGAAGSIASQLTPGGSGDVPAFSSFAPGAGVLPPSGSVGGAGFRAGALPIILLATDTGFAYQPRGETSISGLNGITLPLSALTQLSRPTTPLGSGAGIQETVTALNALGALVIGLGTNAGASLDPRQMLESLAKLTGSTNRSLTTIPNGTVDPIAPGDPLYFQIASGFGSSVANGVTSAIENGATNVAVNITLKSSDPRVRITFDPGVVNNVTAGGTAAFNVTFTGDGRPHRFDLQFVREGTDVVLGSIPVVLGTPINGHGYHYDDLDEGEIDDTIDFGNRRDPLALPNEAPVFTAGPNISVLQDAPDQVIAGWATGIQPGPASEATQTVHFIVSNDNNALFTTQPAIDVDGTLAFRPAPGATGSANVTVTLRDNGGTFNGGIDTSAPQTFTITVNSSTAVVTATSSFDFETHQGITITFNQDVGSELTVSDIQVIDLATSAPVVLQSFSYDSVSHRASVRFDPAVLADGNYRMVIDAGAVPGMAVAHSLEFHALDADATRDRSVNLDDFTALAANFGSTARVFSQGDFNYDGAVTLDDFTTLASQFGKDLPPP
ncbi:MAG TPA: SdrD B-like domain-containing protein, partial [Tepidisphaeraceae bacterium]|nr:SdrD B-like domain-containing protein [Tepidisphaeraceae bacterium]